MAAGIVLFAVAVIGSLGLGLVLWQLWALRAGAAAGSPADAAIGRLCQVFAGGCAAFLGAEFAGPLLVPSTQWDAASVRGCTAAAAVVATAVYVPVVHRWWHHEPRVQLRHRLEYLTWLGASEIAPFVILGAAARSTGSVVVPLVDVVVAAAAFTGIRLFATPWLTVRLAARAACPIELRASVLDTCAAHDVPLRDLIVLEPAGDRDYALAAAYPLTARLRYIVATRTLVEQLPTEEFGAVIYHEIGHLRAIRPRRMIMTDLAYMTFVGLLLRVGGPLVVPALLALQPILYGHQRRMREYAADAYSARFSGAETLAAALTHLHHINATGAAHDPRTYLGATHPPLIDRLDKLSTLTLRTTS